MVSTDSMLSLFSSLCKNLLSSQAAKSDNDSWGISMKHYWTENKSSDVLLKHKKRLLYEILLKKTNRSIPRIQFQLPDFSEIHEILAFIYRMRLARQFDKANRLETLLDKIREKKEFENEIRSCLYFLACLKGTGQEMSEKDMSHPLLPVVTIPKDEVYVLPDGPMMYGDTRIAYYDNRYFMHYPRELFEKEPLPLSNDVKENLNNRLFESGPGYDETGRSLFSFKPNSKPSNKKQMSKSLFGALFREDPMQQHRHPFLEMKLEIPLLSDNPEKRPLDFKLQKLEINIPDKKMLSPDDGFNELDTPGSTSSSNTCEDIWEAALKLESKSYYTWETIGCQEFPKERPFLTESGPRSTEMLWQAIMEELTLMVPNVRLPTLNKISEASLVKDMLNVLIGLPSKTFMFTEDCTRFCFNYGTYIEGITPEALESACIDFEVSGSKLLCLERFSVRKEPDLMKGEGLTLEAFKCGIRKYIENFRGTIILHFLQKDFSLLDLIHKTEPLRRQIQFVTSFCMKVGNDYEKAYCQKRASHMGIKLLSYLYNEALKHWGQDDYLILLFLLKTSCTPYLRFLQHWLFEGVCWDPYAEFNIVCIEKYRVSQDEHYWSHCFKLSKSQPDEKFPLLLPSLTNSVFLCGKSLNLLKVCHPQHCLCNQSKDTFGLEFCVSQDEFEQVRLKTDNYMKRIEERLEHQRESWNKKKMEEKMEKDEQRQAYQQQIEELRITLQEQRNQARQQERDKKRQYYKELEAQIAEEKARKMAEKLANASCGNKDEPQEDVKASADENKIIAEENCESLNAVSEGTDLIGFEESQLPNWARRALSAASNASNEPNLSSAEEQNIKAAKNDGFPEEISKLLSSTEGLPKWAVPAFEGSNPPQSRKQNIAVVAPLQESNRRSWYGRARDDSALSDKLFCESSQTYVRRARKNVYGHASDSTAQAVIYGWTSNDDKQDRRKLSKATSLSQLAQNEVDACSESRQMRRADSDLGLKNSTKDYEDRNEVLESEQSQEKNNDESCASESVAASRSNTASTSSSDEAYASGSSSEEKNDSKMEHFTGFSPNKSLQKGLSEVFEEGGVPGSNQDSNKGPYWTDSSIFCEMPGMRTIFATFNKATDAKFSTKDDGSFTSKYMPLPVLLNRSILPPIEAQVRLVNQSILSYFKEQLPLKDHFLVLRNFLFFQDGEFGQALSQLLYDKLSRCLQSPEDLLNPFSLNSILAEALESSLHGNTQFTENLSFAVKKIPKYFSLGDSAALKCLELRYKVLWPCNIIITESHIDMYNKVFAFILQVKYALWSLNQVWYHLKYTATIYDNHRSPHLQILQLYRHEMLHVVRILQSYIISQVLQDLWKDFEKRLDQRTESLDDLIGVHQWYLEQAMQRCMIEKNGESTQLTKVINKMLDTVVQFHGALTYSKHKRISLRSKIPQPANEHECSSAGDSNEGHVKKRVHFQDESDSLKDCNEGKSGSMGLAGTTNRARHKVLTSKTWYIDADTNLLVHSSYEQLSKLHKQFKENARYLYKVCTDKTKISIPHQEKLLILLDAGSHYETSLPETHS